MAEITTEPRQRPTVAVHRKIREAYVRGEGSLRALSRRFGLSFWTVTDWSDAEDWTDLRAAFDRASRDRFMASVQPMAVPPPASPSDDATQAGKLARIEKQLGRVYTMLESCDVKEMKPLVEAEQRLLNCWALLTGFPRPGTRKHSRRSQPILPPPEPEPVDPGYQEPEQPTGAMAGAVPTG